MALDPLPKKQWTPELAAHLLNRAGFGGSPSEVEALYSLGHAGAVERMVQLPPTAGLPDPVWANPFSARRDEDDGPGMRSLDEHFVLVLREAGVGVRHGVPRFGCGVGQAVFLARGLRGRWRLGLSARE